MAEKACKENANLVITVVHFYSGTFNMSQLTIRIFFCSVYYLYPLWQKLWSRHSAKQNSGEKRRRKKSKPSSILWSLALAVGPTLAVSAAYELVYVLLQFASPQLLNLLIAFVQGEGPTWHGYFFTVLFSVVALASAIFDSGYWYRVNLVGLRLRSALSSAIYRKSLRLSNGARKKYTGTEKLHY